MAVCSKDLCTEQVHLFHSDVWQDKVVNKYSLHSGEVLFSPSTVTSAISRETAALDLSFDVLDWIC